MRIDRITIQNFKGFEDRSFDFPAPPDGNGEGSFHVLIGDNGSGKSTTLDALAVAMGIWHVAKPAAGWRSIRPGEARLVVKNTKAGTRFDPMPSPTITALGQINGEEVIWTRKNREHSTRTTNAEAKKALTMVQALLDRTRTPDDSTTLPVLAYYGAGRAWKEGNTRSENQRSRKRVSRFDAYFYCLEGQIGQREINHWFMQESFESFQRKAEREGMTAVENAILSCIPGGGRLRYDTDRKEIVLTIHDQEIPFYSLSDGQRSMLSMVADLAIKCVVLNPHLGKECAVESPGMVLIDELDLHLHPNWQRQVVENLRVAFPKIQFVSTTHSPFIIQTLRPGELISLDSQPVEQLANLGVETIARGLMKVERPEVSPRYSEMKMVAKHYLSTLETAKKSPREKLKAYKQELAASLAPYADNPAFQAFLEMKQEAALGKASSTESGNGLQTS